MEARLPSLSSAALTLAKTRFHHPSLCPPSAFKRILSPISQSRFLRIYLCTSYQRRRVIWAYPTLAVLLRVWRPRTSALCRHWRETALECSTLWAFIDGVSAQWLATMLERSKKAALVVIYNDPKPLRQCGFEKILLQLPRIKFLQLCPSPPEADRILDCLSSLPAPLLHTFKFVVFGNATFAKPISDTIFQGEAPRLRSVQLVQCYFSWTSCIFSGLRSLHIGLSPKRSPLSQILSALRRMPELELLTLEPRSSKHSDAPFDQVALPRLRRVELSNSTIQIATSFFLHLVLPVDVWVVLSLTKIESAQSFC